eukprot:COSAG06_NODE_51538_length_311_cov_0.976415_1_plen_78_part_00
MCPCQRSDSDDDGDDDSDSDDDGDDESDSSEAEADDDGSGRPSSILRYYVQQQLGRNDLSEGAEGLNIPSQLSRLCP